MNVDCTFDGLLFFVLVDCTIWWDFFGNCWHAQIIVDRQRQSQNKKCVRKKNQL